MDIVVVILGIIVGLVVWQLYHKLFNVVYFSFKAVLAELFVCVMIGMVIVSILGGLLFKFWWIALIIVAILLIGKKVS